jgi:predicted adenylyl cyclase CyaB
MIELELKAVVPDANELALRLKSVGAREEFSGRMVDQRLDYADGSMTSRDEVLRLRVYHDRAGIVRASLDWKGPAGVSDGYKRREEINSAVPDPTAMMTILRNIGLRVTRSIDREIEQFDFQGAVVRIERYEQMDDLVEVEGSPVNIERAIQGLGIPRDQFSPDSLALFAERFTARTGEAAITGTDGDAPGASP